jgi:hypothetical protein
MIMHSGGSSEEYKVPAGSPEWITEDLLRDTIETWQPYYSTRLTELEAVEILQRVGTLLDTITGDMP